MTFFLEHAAAFLALAVVACGAGWWVVRWLPEAGRLERVILAASLGLVVLAQVGFFLGLLGMLRPGPVLGVAVVAVLSLLISRRAGGGSSPLAQPPPPRGEGLRLRRMGLFLIAALLALAPFWLMSLYPPTGFDAMLYHLPMARAFVETGGLPFLSELRFPVFPQANEVLFALVMLFSGDVAAHGVELLSVWLTAALLLVWGREVFGPVAGWGAAAVFLGNPIVAHLGADAYVEAGLTLFTTAALYSVWRWRRGEGPLAWLALAAAFGSAAAGTKYLGLFFLGLVGLATFLPRRGSGFALRLRALAVAGVVVLAVAGPWYGRILAWTGNPLFPFAPDLFGESAWDPLNFRTFASLSAEDLPPEPPISAVKYAERTVSLARLPWDVVFTRELFGQQPPYSPAYLLALPLALLLAWRDPRLRWLLLTAAAYAYACLALPRDSRYLLPAAPLASLAAGAVLAWVLTLRPLSGRFRPWAAVFACVLAFLPGWCYGIYRMHRQGPVPVTAEQRDAYLSRRLPFYPALAHVNRARGGEATVYGLWAEEMIYYAEGCFLGDWYGPTSYRRLLRGVRGAADLHRALDRYGVDYLLVASGRQRLPVPEDAAFRRLFRQVYADPDARVFELMRLPR